MQSCCEVCDCSGLLGTRLDAGASPEGRVGGVALIGVVDKGCGRVAMGVEAIGLAGSEGDLTGVS